MASVRINRELLLSRLQSVQPGVSQREFIEQSSCFVFQDGYVLTYNDEVACRMKSGLGDITGAVPAKKLLELLTTWDDEEVDLEDTEGELAISGTRKRCGIRMENEVLLAVSSVEKPKTWKPLHKDFSDAVAIVGTCASTDESRFRLTCIYFHPKFMEACDNVQLTRYKIKSDIEQAFLIPHKSMRHVAALGMVEFSETASWVHFKNPNGLVFSCRRYMEDYPDFGKFIDFTGEPVTLPGGLAEAVGRANVFSADNPNGNKVFIDLKPGKVRIKSEGVSGWSSEAKKLKYVGRPLAFMIHPKLLIDLTARHNTCEVTEERLKVDAGKYVYVSCLTKVSKDEPAIEEEEGQEETPAEKKRTKKRLDKVAARAE